MDRTTDLTLEALISRERNLNEALDHFHERNRERDGFSIIGIKRSRELDRIAEFMEIAERPKELDCFETYQVWLNAFGTPHPGHVKADPYSFMWGNDMDCDRCGKLMTPLNRPDPCYGVCTACEVEMSESPDIEFDGELEPLDTP